MGKKTPPTLVHVFAQNMHYRLVACETLANSYFGGPLPMKITGKAHGPEPLHHCVTLGPTDIPLLREHHLHLPLLYGMRFDGCQLTYRLATFNEIEIVDIHPKRSSNDWPYLNYPKLLPYVQLTVSERKRCSWQRFADSFWNLPEKLPCDVFVLVLPPTNIGVSLWGREQEAEVGIVWEFDATSKTVRAYNVCD